MGKRAIGLKNETENCGNLALDLRLCFGVLCIYAR